MSQITNPYAVGQMSRRMMAAALDNAYRLERDTQNSASGKGEGEAGDRREHQNGCHRRQGRRFSCFITKTRLWIIPHRP